MRAKSMVLIVIALGCGLVASIAISQVMERGSRGNSAAMEMVQIYVATADIDANEQLTASNVRMEDWPKSKVPEGSITDFNEINEHFARVRFYAGEPILKLKLADELEGPAIKIPDGHRVCSLRVQMDTAVSGLISPGDRVDIFGYFKEGRGIPQTGTREILKNVRVFAVNSQTSQETDQEGRALVAKTVSVLVKQDQVAKLMLAAELGTLRLALRRPNEDSEVTSGENATIETLFGTRSEDADEKSSPSADTPAGALASAAGGFVGFLNSIKSQNAMAAAAGSSGGLLTPGPAWQMTLLTPDGGQQYTWNNEGELPVLGGGATAAPPVPPIAVPQPVPPAAPAPATPAAAAPPTPAATPDDATPPDAGETDNGLSEN